MPVKSPPEPGLRERKKARLRKQIIDTTVEFIRARGYEAVTVDAIIRHVEISAPTFYNYFDSKDAVLAAYVQQAWERLVDVVPQTRGTEPTTRGVVSNLVSAIAREMRSQRDLWRVIFLTDTYNPDRFEQLQATEVREYDVLAELLRAAQEQGEVSTQYPADLLARLLDGMLFTVCRDWAINDLGPHSLKKRMLQSVEIFFRGVAT